VDNTTVDIITVDNIIVDNIIGNIPNYIVIDVDINSDNSQCSYPVQSPVRDNTIAIVAGVDASWSCRGRLSVD